MALATTSQPVLIPCALRMGHAKLAIWLAVRRQRSSSPFVQSHRGRARRDGIGMQDFSVRQGTFYQLSALTMFLALCHLIITSGASSGGQVVQLDVLHTSFCTRADTIWLLKGGLCTYAGTSSIIGALALDVCSSFSLPVLACSCAVVALTVL